MSTSSSDPTASQHPFREAWALGRRALLATVVCVLPLAWGIEARFGALHRNRSTATRAFEELRGVEEIDLLVLGTSRATHGIDPDGFPADRVLYNFAQQGAALRMSRIHLDHLIAGGLRPRVVLVEVGPHLFDSVKLWRRPYHDVKLLGIATAMEGQKTAFGQLGLREKAQILPKPLWQHRATPEDFLFGRGWDPPGAKPRYIEDFSRYRRGFVPLEPLHADARRGKQSAQFFDPAEIEALALLIDRLQEIGARVILFEMPVLFQHLPEGLQDRYRSIVADLVNREGLPWIEPDSIRSLAGRQDLYWDATHLNREGARLYSQELSGKIERLLSPEDP